MAGGPGGAAPPVGVWGQRPQLQGPGASYARSFICRPARFLKGRLVFQADYLLVRLPITKPTISRHTLYNSGHPLSSIIRSPVLHAYSPPSSICLDRHRSSVYRAHGWTAISCISSLVYQNFFVFSPAFHRALAFCCYLPLRTIFLHGIRAQAI